MVQNFDIQRLEAEHVVGRLKSLELIERLARFSNARSPVEQRMEAAVNSLPAQFREAALMAFSTILYIPNLIFNETWRSLWKSLNNYFDHTLENEEFIIFELDRDQLRDQFYKSNYIRGRLDNNSMFKASGDIIDSLITITGGNNIDEYIERFRILKNRKIWILLSDISLSGTSLASELDRLKHLRDLLFPNSAIQIYCLVQLISKQALVKIKDKQIILIPGIQIPKESCIGSDCYNLLSATSKEIVLNLCDWFCEDVILHNDSFIQQYTLNNGKNVGGLGFGGHGFSIVTERNTPNNSLPIFWFKGEIKSTGTTYLPPFERLDSRKSASGEGRRVWLENLLQDQIKMSLIKNLIGGI